MALAPSYKDARQQFIRAAERLGCRLESLKLGCTDPDGDRLGIDIAWLGADMPTKVFLHVSGTHGIEGFAGSAIQCKLLEELPRIQEDCAYIFVHVLNPWGMAHCRRVDAGNIDFNRNFLVEGEAYAGAPELYSALDPLLNPKTAPERRDLFIARLLLAVVQHGFVAVKQSIAGGQYEFDKGLFYGGKELAESLVVFREWLCVRLATVKKVVALEIHTGLGKFGEDVLFWVRPPEDPDSKLIARLFPDRLVSDSPDSGVGYRTAGDLQHAIPALLPNANVIWVMQEFGTYGLFRVLTALRNENRYHFHSSKSAGIGHWSKRELREVFSPASDRWEKKILARGRAAFESLLSIL